MKQIFTHLNKHYTLKKTITLIIISLLLTACSKPIPKKDGIMVLSVSSNGRYVIATTFRKKLILFDIKNHTQKILNNNANIYSAYFAKQNNAFIWQDATTNLVTVQNVNGKVIKTFNPGFATYGQVMGSKLNLYVASNVDFNLYFQKDGKHAWNKLGSTGFYGFGKLLNLTLSNDNKQLLTSGGDDEMHTGNAIPFKDFNKTQYPPDSVILWNINTLQPIYGFPGNSAGTFATFSPNNNFVASTDEGSALRVWKVHFGKYVYTGYSIYSGKLIITGPKDDDYKFDSSALKARMPKDFISPGPVGSHTSNDYSLSVKFVDNTHFLRFIFNIPYAILYSVNDPSPLKYLKLNTNPYPSINDYSADQSIDTSAQTHTLVLGHAMDTGITVYKYDPKQQTLKVIWIAKPNIEPK